MLKIFKVTFNDGGWHSNGIPTQMEVAETKEEAIKNALERDTCYVKGYDIWATEFKLDGYVIEVYDEKTYNREKNLEKLV
jgi:hypothetical protein